MAAPHVTGAAALFLGINPAYTAAQIKTLLQTAANADAYTGTCSQLHLGIRENGCGRCGLAFFRCRCGDYP